MCGGGGGGGGILKICTVAQARQLFIWNGMVLGSAVFFSFGGNTQTVSKSVRWHKALGSSLFLFSPFFSFFFFSAHCHSFFRHTVILGHIIFLCSISGKLDLNSSSLNKDRKHAAHVVLPAHLESLKSSGSFLICPGKTNSSMTGYHKATPQCIRDLG